MAKAKAKTTKPPTPQTTPEAMQKKKEQWANECVDNWYTNVIYNLDCLKKEIERYQRHGKVSPGEKIENLAFSVNACRQMDFHYYGAMKAVVHMADAFRDENN